MDYITWKYVKKLENPNSVSDFILKNNLTLPKKLVECITENNGGRPSITDFETNKGKEYVFKSLLSFNESDAESIYKFYDFLAVSEFFPFAMDASGNFICYDLKSKNYVLWKHETDTTEKILME